MQHSIVIVHFFSYSPQFIQQFFICEVKYSRQEVKFSVIEEMQKKINTLVTPRGFSCFPVLIHVNGVHDNVLESDYFMNIINFEEILV